jgi:hypothetical protein
VYLNAKLWFRNGLVLIRIPARNWAKKVIDNCKWTSKYCKYKFTKLYRFVCQKCQIWCWIRVRNVLFGSDLAKKFRSRPDQDLQHGLDVWLHYSPPLFPRTEILLLSETLPMIEKLCTKLFLCLSVVRLLLNRKQLLRWYRLKFGCMMPHFLFIFYIF